MTSRYPVSAAEHTAAVDGMENLGRSFVVRTPIRTGCCSPFLTLIPVMEQPIIQERLTSCLLGGIVGGFAGGMLLTCGCKAAAGWTFWACASPRRKKSSTVGRFNTTRNVVLYSPVSGAV